MLKIVFLIFLATLLVNITCFAQSINITIVYNNVPYDNNLEADWGFSAFIKGLEKDILFDAGRDGSALLSNMTKLKIDPKDIEILFLSHLHGDHVGGLGSVLGKNSNILVYLPQSFPAELKDNAGKSSRGVISVDKPIEICKGVWTTGEMGSGVIEQSMVIESSEGLTIITGCAHPGIVDIVRFAKEYFKKDIHVVLGGFHLLTLNDGQIQEVISQLKQLGVKKVGPSHCTGTKAMELFREAWGKDFLELGCGADVIVK